MTLSELLHKLRVARRGFVGRSASGHAEYGDIMITAEVRDELVTLLERWEAGQLTPSEIHNLCHNLRSVSVEQFAEGCRQEMLKLYGTCPFEALDSTNTDD